MEIRKKIMTVLTLFISTPAFSMISIEDSSKTSEINQNKTIEYLKKDIADLNPELPISEKAKGCCADDLLLISDVPRGHLEHIIFKTKIDVPDGVNIQKSPTLSKEEEFGLFASKEFKAGSLIYSAQARHLPNLPFLWSYVYELPDGTNRTIHLDRHASLDSHDKWYLYGFDSFMNHSCAANTKDVFTELTPTSIFYNQIATRDIHVGEELTYNYALFYWTTGEEFLCQCQSSNCFKWFKGFKFLPKEVQIELLPDAFPDIQEQYKKSL